MDQELKRFSTAWWLQGAFTPLGFKRWELAAVAVLIITMIVVGIMTGPIVPCPNGSCLPR